MLKSDINNNTIRIPVPRRPCAAVRVEEDCVAGGKLEGGGHEEPSADQSPPHGSVLRGEKNHVRPFYLRFVSRAFQTNDFKQLLLLKIIIYFISM